MRDPNKRRQELVSDLTSLQQRITQLETAEARQKQVELALRASEERFRSVFNNASVAIAVVDKEGHVLEANEADCRFLGYDRQELIGMHFSEFTHPDDFNVDLHLYNAMVRGERDSYVIDKRYVRKGGEVVWGRLSVSLVRDDTGQPEYTTVICQDITQRQGVEEVLRAERDKAQKYLDIAGVIIVALDTEGVITLINRKGLAVLGYEEGEVIGTSWVDTFLPARVREEVRAVFHSLMAGHIELAEYYENPCLTKGGEERLIAWYNTLVTDAGGNIIGTLSSGEDITERVRAEAALRESEEKYRQLFELESDAIFLIDNETGRILEVNAAASSLYGYTREELLERNNTDLSVEPDQTRRATVEGWLRVPVRFHRKKDGTIFPVEITGRHFTRLGRQVHIAAIRDITERIQLEEQLRHAQKMEAVGRLTAGIAHDFNNLLTAINGFAELMRLEVASGSSTWQLVEKILESGRRAADLVRQLLAFSRKQIIEPRVLNLNHVVSRMGKLLRRIIGEHIRMETSLATDLWQIEVDPAQIEQIVVNLAINARDAMPGGGRLTIETSNIILDEQYAGSHLEVQPGEYVQLSVSDTGIGMSAEVREHIFEPFFTTKEVGQGTGLGLATVYGIVKQNAGHIWVYSEEDRGSTFNIYLPRVRQNSRPMAERLRTAHMPRGDETILLVEDDAGVRDLARSTLQRQGYAVLEARNSRQARKIFTQHPSPVHLLLTDVVMPGIGGKALADQLAQIQPELRTLFMSGYTDNAIVHHGVLETGVAFLQKPFTPAALAHKVRQVLDAPQGETARGTEDLSS